MKKEKIMEGWAEYVEYDRGGRSKMRISMDGLKIHKSEAEAAVKGMGLKDQTGS